MINKEKKDRYSDVTYNIKYKSILIVKLKVIKFRKNIICYLCFYMQYSYF